MFFTDNNTTLGCGDWDCYKVEEVCCSTCRDFNRLPFGQQWPTLHYTNKLSGSLSFITLNYAFRCNFVIVCCKLRSCSAIQQTSRIIGTNGTVSKKVCDRPTVTLLRSWFLTWLKKAKLILSCIYSSSWKVSLHFKTNKQ